MICPRSTVIPWNGGDHGAGDIDSGIAGNEGCIKPRFFNDDITTLVG